MRVSALLVRGLFCILGFSLLGGHDCAGQARDEVVCCRGWDRVCVKSGVEDASCPPNSESLHVIVALGQVQASKCFSRKEQAKNA